MTTTAQMNFNAFGKHAREKKQSHALVRATRHAKMIHSLIYPFLQIHTQTPLKTPETKAESRRKKKFTSVCNNETVASVLRRSLDWRTISTWNAFARRSKRHFLATEPCRTMKMPGKSFSWVGINERMLRNFWRPKKFVMRRVLCCTVSKK